jgi:hypothetical protein
VTANADRLHVIYRHVIFKNLVDFSYIVIEDYIQHITYKLYRHVIFKKTKLAD